MTKDRKINSFELINIHFKNELKAIFTDSGAVLILVGALLIYPILYSFGYFNEVLTDLPVGVVDLDQTPTSRKYTAMLDATRDVSVAYNPQDLTEAEELFMANKISGVLLIQRDFQKNILAGEQANVAVYADGSYMLKYKTFYLAASTVNAYFGGGVSVKRYMAEGKSFRQAKVASSPFDVQTHMLYNPSGSYGSFIMPGLIIIIIQQTLLIGIGILGGTFSESKASPFVLSQQNRTKEIVPLLFGRVGAYILLSLFNICLAVIVIHHWFHYPDKAGMLNVLMLLFPFLLAVIFLGIGLSTLFKHRESAIVFMMFLSPIALFLSGISWPVSAMPDWLVGLSKILPGTTAVPAYLRLRTMGVSLIDIRSELFFLYRQAGIYAALTIGYFFLRIYIDRRKPSNGN
ncbi:ABC transporter permease [Sunxiuqinia indica]|uniref:ABC transporter permease n=1 Tax=Sunxiuqinia indica TaxID=2692584 RepID=UPI00135CC137|nr:ABC transporter permease [Sunxiuqinia indica]